MFTIYRKREQQPKLRTWDIYCYRKLNLYSAVSVHHTLNLHGDVNNSYGLCNTSAFKIIRETILLLVRIYTLKSCSTAVSDGVFYG